MPHRTLLRLETRRSGRADLQDTLVVDHCSMRVIELPPDGGLGSEPRRELPSVVGLLAALVIAGCLLFIVDDGGEPASPALGTAPAATAQG